jgi:hypothetical protein
MGQKGKDIVDQSCKSLIFEKKHLYFGTKFSYDWEKYLPDVGMRFTKFIQMQG